MLVRSMTALAPAGSYPAASANGSNQPLSPRPRLPVSMSATDARLAMLEQQLVAAEQQREAANRELLVALQRADVAAADVARCAALTLRLQELEVRALGGASQNSVVNYCFVCCWLSLLAVLFVGCSLPAAAVTL